MDLLIRRAGSKHAALRALLEAEGYETAEATDADYARRLLSDEGVDVVIVDRCTRILAALEDANIGLWDWDLHSNRVSYSREWKRQLGCENQELGDDISEWRSRVHPDDRERALESIRACIEERLANAELELRMRHADGSYRWVLVQTSLSRNERGRPIQLLGAQIDITDRKREQLALAERERHLRQCIEHTPVELAMFDRDMRYLAASRAWRKSYRLDDDCPLLGRSHYEVFPEIPERWKQIHQRCLAGAVERCDEDRFPRADGTVDWLRWEVRPWRQSDGSVGGLVMFTEVITGRRHTQQALRETEAHLRWVSDTVPHLIWELTPEGVLRYANRAWHEYFGRETVAGCRWRELVHPDDLALAINVSSLESERALSTVRLRRHDGEYRWFSSHAAPVRDAEGTLLYVVGSSTDVHALKTTRDALRESQTRLVTALRAAGMGTWRWDVDADRVAIDASFAQLLGRDPRSFEHLSLTDAIAQLGHPEDIEATEQAIRQSLAEGPGSEFSIEWRALHPDGTPAWLTTQGRVERDPSDGRLSLVGASVDITRHKLLEEQLRQAQKMEAIGQLAGGVAHDFNNILTVILGHASMLEAHPKLAPELAGALTEIVVAAERAASLTGQLLAFGRQQIMQKRDLDLNTLIAEVMNMLLRLLGEHIDCRFEPAPEPVHVHADPGSLTQVILNLAVNARDAMPNGGRLEISTHITQLEQGPSRERVERDKKWAQLRVRDTGCGIGPEVLPHIFDPFFTTKGVGHGTGLGLATVYGIVEQHRGHIHVDTSPGRGTTFQVSLPLAQHRPSHEPPHPRRAAPKAQGETILLIEDEASVRSLAKAVLEQHGYVVIDAGTGACALELWASHAANIDLVLTDLVLRGGLSGLQLVERLRAQRPELKVLLTSGHAEEPAGTDTSMREDAYFLEKPYDVTQLLAAVRGALDDDLG